MNPEPLPKLAVLISGSGTTFQNLIDRAADGSLPARIALVVSSRSGVLGIERALRAGLPVDVISRKEFADPGEFCRANFEAIRRTGADLVCLAGYLQKLTVPVDFRGRVLNIHPSLLPKFGGKGMYGRHVHEAVLQAGEAESGCTIHFVDDEYDHGEMILQAKVSIKAGDTPESLAGRIFERECWAYPEAIRRVISARAETV